MHWRARARDWKILGIGKGATYFNPRLLELQHEFTRNPLTHKNPYTGNEYRHEPAVITIEMVNENSLLEAWTQWRLVARDDKAGDTGSPIPASYAKELTEPFNAWLPQHRPPEQVAAAALLPRLAPNEFTNATALRFHTEAEFYMNVESNFFAGMKRLIRDELGSRSLLFGSGDHTDGFAGYAHVRTYTPDETIEALRLTSWQRRPFFKPDFELTTPCSRWVWLKKLST